MKKREFGPEWAGTPDWLKRETVRIFKAGGAWQMLLRHRGKQYAETIEPCSFKDYKVKRTAFEHRVRSGEFDRAKIVKASAAKAHAEMYTYRAWGDYRNALLLENKARLSAAATYGSIRRTGLYPHLGDFKLDEITWPMIEMAMHVLKRKYAMRSVKLAFDVLSADFRKAVDSEVIAKSPVKRFQNLELGKIESPRERAERTTLKPEQIRALCEATCPREEDADGSQEQIETLLIGLLLATGARIGEIAGLQWRDIDFIGGTLRIERAVKKVCLPGEGTQVWVGDPKSKWNAERNTSKRTMAIETGTLARLKAEKARQEGFTANVKRLVPDDAFVFPDNLLELRKPCDPAHLYRAFKVRARRAGLPASLSPHWLRHTHLSLAAAAGVPLPDLQRRAGHANGSLTADVYLHAAGSAGDKLAAAVGDDLFGKGPSRK